MIKTICGLKGSGKTKRIIEAANQSVVTATGNVIFITDTKRYTYDIVPNVRFIDVSDYGINSKETLLSFMKGIIAGNSDTQFIYIDGAARITKCDVADMKDFYDGLEALTALETLHGDFLNFTLTVSADPASVPEFMKKYAE